MRRPTSLALLLAVVLLGCRPIPPTSGTPVSPTESLRVGVVREHHGWGLSRSDLVSSGQRLARDVAALLADLEPSRSVSVLLPRPENGTALPAASFRPIAAQLVREITVAGEPHGIHVLQPDEPGSESARYTLELRVYGLAREGGFFVVDYRLARAEDRGTTSD